MENEPLIAEPPKAAFLAAGKVQNDLMAGSKAARRR
jgi:hypothetical protein